MKILEVWQDHQQNIFAIVEHNQQAQLRYDCKHYEALWLDDVPDYGQLTSFGGVPGFDIAEFDTLASARNFLIKGITLQDSEPDIWWELVALSSNLQKGGDYR